MATKVEAAIAVREVSNWAGDASGNADIADNIMRRFADGALCDIAQVIRCVELARDQAKWAASKADEALRVLRTFTK